MSARLVAVTALLLDVLDGLQLEDRPTPSEDAFLALLGDQIEELTRIRHLATAEMNGLAPALMEASA